MYGAMKSGDKDKAGTLRTLLAKLKDRQINNRKDLTEKEGISVVKILVKQREEAADMYEKAGRESLAQKEKFEFDVLNSYLPQTMSVTFNTRPKAEIDDLVAFFETLNGVSKFQMTIDDTNGTETIKVVCKTWSQTWDYDNFYSLSATFERVYEA